MKLEICSPKNQTPKLFRNLVLGVCGILSAASLSAAPYVNDFTTLADLNPYGGSVTLDNHSGAGPLTTTVVGEGAFGQGIFSDNHWLSLDKSAEQYFFSLTGAASVGATAAKINNVEFVIGGVGSVSVTPVIVGGNWSFNVYDAVSTQYYGGGAVPTDKSYYRTFYIAPVVAGSPAGIVYEFDSFSAVPEPSAILLAGLGLAAVCLQRRKRKASC